MKPPGSEPSGPDRTAWAAVAAWGLLRWRPELQD